MKLVVIFAITIAIALYAIILALGALTVVASAQTTTFRDRAGNVIGTAHQGPENTTTFRDRSGNVTGTARTRR